MPLWLADAPLVLASRSKARQTLLAAVGIPFETRPADIDERALEAAAGSLPPGAIAAFLAREKASAVAKTYPGRLILGADQTLALGAERFAKPADRSAALAQLAALRGKTHELHSAVTFVQDGKVAFEHVDVARLTMRALSDSFLGLYLDAVGSAATESIGAYQIEGLGAQLFERVDGDYFTVLGLPLIAVLNFLRRQNCLAR
jgi:septum formation protein